MLLKRWCLGQLKSNYSRSTDIILCGRNVFVCVVAGCRNLETALALARETVLRTVVGVLIGDGSGRLVVGVERAVGSAAGVGASRLLATVECARTKEGRVHTRCVDYPWEGRSGRDECCEDCLLHDCLCCDVMRLKERRPQLARRKRPYISVSSNVSSARPRRSDLARALIVQRASRTHACKPRHTGRLHLVTSTRRCDQQELFAWKNHTCDGVLPFWSAA